ncbi:MAG: hypothetical protein QXL47_03555 [Candidatus Anstonellales archaeon]
MTATTDFIVNVGSLVAVLIVIAIMWNAISFQINEQKKFLANDIAKKVSFLIMESYEKGWSNASFEYGGKVFIGKGVVFAGVDGQESYFPYPLELNASGEFTFTKEVHCSGKERITCGGS